MVPSFGNGLSSDEDRQNPVPGVRTMTPAKQTAAIELLARLACRAAIRWLRQHGRTVDKPEILATLNAKIKERMERISPLADRARRLALRQVAGTGFEPVTSRL